MVARARPACDDADDADETIALRDWQIDAAKGSFRPFFTRDGASHAGTFGTVRSANGAVDPEIVLSNFHLDGDLSALFPTMALVVGTIAVISATYHQLIRRFPGGGGGPEGLAAAFGCDVRDYGIVPDTLEATRAALRRAAAETDVIVTSGGVSVGEADYVKPAVEAEGKLLMWRIAMKPGRPLAFGSIGKSFFIGLPGNPVSSFVTFLIFVRPFLLRTQGMSQIQPKITQARADFDWPEPDARREFLRVKWNAQGGLDLYPTQDSAVLTSTAWADGLVDNPAGHAIRKGEMVRFLSYSELYW